jgi:peroxiredoxin
MQGFKVSGIPTRFVIDKNGHIRFKLVGFNKEHEAAAIDELAAMIGLAGKSIP